MGGMEGTVNVAFTPLYNPFWPSATYPAQISCISVRFGCAWDADTGRKEYVQIEVKVIKNEVIGGKNLL